MPDSLHGQSVSGANEPILPTGDTVALDRWRIKMREYTVHVNARDYESAVAWLEAWCNDRGIRRSGAAFFNESKGQ